MRENPSLVVRTFKVDGVDLLCDISRGVVRPLVPASLQKSFFEAIHSIAHPGIRATRRMLSSRFVWPHMARDVAGWSRDCQQCVRGKVLRHVHTTPEQIAVPQRRFAHVHGDSVGPLPVSKEGFNYLLTAVDRSTRWAEVFPLKDISTSSCMQAFTAGWISRFGVPDDLTSDRGTQFTAGTWTDFCKRLGIKHHLTTAYHPQANGLVERFHRQLKEALRAKAAGDKWMDSLPWVLFGLRSAPKEDSSLSSAELVYGAPLSLPGEFLGSQDMPVETLVDRVRAGLPNFEPPVTRPCRPEAGEGLPAA
jgi:transposase InsO family protein